MGRRRLRPRCRSPRPLAQPCESTSRTRKPTRVRRGLPCPDSADLGRRVEGTHREEATRNGAGLARLRRERKALGRSLFEPAYRQTIFGSASEDEGRLSRHVRISSVNKKGAGRCAAIGEGTG
jgi:hypothetical protein